MITIALNTRWNIPTNAVFSFSSTHSLVTQNALPVQLNCFAI